MSQYDILFRALLDYRKNTRDDRECTVQRSAIISANSEADTIEITRKNCKIETDWIEAIERGIEFIEKAIKEERQFIRSNGEVIPIEKVKRVSKDSVEHLARHSNLVTREPEDGKDVVPDQLYTVERLSDYAVYENRFLYMLLCYLRDFIGMRYERIVEVTNTYSGSMEMNKTVVESNRRLEYQVKLVEEKKNDEYLKEHNDAQDSIDRILMIYRAVVHFLNTPLMVEVAKAPMLKPPVTRTNVLRMNRNFREALTLYEYVSAYDKVGYEILTDVKNISPFVGALAEEISETVELSSFLTYEYGLGIKEFFKRRYERDEEKRKRDEQEKYAEQLKSIKRHLKDGQITPEEYIAMLEKRVHDLEGNIEDLANARITIDELHAEVDRLSFDLKHSKSRIASLEDNVLTLTHKYEEDMEEARVRHAGEIQDLKFQQQEEIDRINVLHADEIQEINSIHEKEIEDIKGVCDEKVEKMAEYVETVKEDCEKLITEKDEFIASERAKFEADIISEQNKYKEEREKFQVLFNDYERLTEEKDFAKARLIALRSQYGLISNDEDFTSKETIDELEQQYNVFRKFFKGEWKKAKKLIRKEVFSTVREEERKRKELERAKKNKEIDFDAEFNSQEYDVQEYDVQEVTQVKIENDGYEVSVVDETQNENVE